MSHENFTTPVSTKEPAIMSMTDLTSGSIEVATMIDLVISEDEKHNEQTNESNLPQNNAFTRLIQSSKNNAPAKAITARDRKVSLPKTGKKRKTTHGKHDLSPDFSPRSPYIYDRMLAVSNHLIRVVAHHEGCPNVSAIATVIANNVPARYQQLMQQTCNLATAARDKFNQMFVNQGGKSFNIMQIYKGFSILNPVSLRNKTQEQRLEAINNIVTLVPACRLMNENNLMRSRLIAELDELNNRANLINIDDDDENVVGDGPSLLLWWRNNGDALPDWKIVLHDAVLFQPSSATSERIFSMIDWMFVYLQEAALEDYKETSLILRYNTIWRSKYD
jgi:hypothetical protein